MRPRLGGEGMEILDGVGRARLASESGVEHVTALVKVLEDEQARRFVVDANLYRVNTQACVKLVPAIVLAVEHERSGGAYRVERILEVTGVSGATYKRAKAGLNFAVGRLRTEHPDLESGTEAEVVACLTRQLWQEFAQFYSWELEPYGFYKRVYGESRQGKARRKKAPPGEGTQAPPADAGLAEPGRAGAGGGPVDERQEVLDTFNAFLTLAKGNHFPQHLWEFPALRAAIYSRDEELEAIVPYLDGVTRYLKNRLSERRAALKKMRPADPNQISLGEALQLVS